MAELRCLGRVYAVAHGDDSIQRVEVCLIRFAASGIVEAFEQTFEYVLEEIVLLIEHLFKIERSHIAHESLGKLVSFLRVGNVNSKKGNTATGESRSEGFFEK